MQASCAERGKCKIVCVSKLEGGVVGVAEKKAVSASLTGRVEYRMWQIGGKEM